MYYVEVLVSSLRYHGTEPLTYSSNKLLLPGTIVEVPLGQKNALGIVLHEAPKPNFKTRPLSKPLIDKPLPGELLSLYHWIKQYYPAPVGSIAQLLVPGSLGTSSRRKPPSSALKYAATLPSLTPDQRRAVETITTHSGSFLLHGETGSGKTRVYIELARDVLQHNKSAIVLTPEIGLTPQLTQEFDSAFPGQVTVIHSTQTVAERRDNWLKIINNPGPQIVLGPRSALFSPLKDIGVIVVDEAHDGAYKQEQMPYYQATRVAAQLAHLHGAKLVLGSATPLIHDYFAFEAKKLPIIRMASPASGQKEVEIEVIDLKDRQQFSKSPWLSDQMIRSVESAMRDGYQSLIFLNRRGTARVVLCENCGWQAMCPHCDIPLTYHGDRHKLQCHTCGYVTNTPTVCPDCRKPEIKFKSIGTKALAIELERLFPGSRIARFDSDNSKTESLPENFNAIKRGEIDILIGTQLLSKGLDLPKLKVIGVVLADTGMYFPDFSAEERTFQMLRQVIGRVGRGHLAGTVILQTYHPDSTTIKAVVDHDYADFYATQLRERELYRFPPYYYLLKITVERSVQTSARKAAHELAEHLIQSGLAIEVSGPSPSFSEKAGGKFRWQLVLKAKQRTELTKAIRLLPKNCNYDIDPTNLL